MAIVVMLRKTAIVGITLVKSRFSLKNQKFADEANHTQSWIVYSRFTRQIVYFEMAIVIILRKSAIVRTRLAETASCTTRWAVA
jgi:hypothetical protein